MGASGIAMTLGAAKHRKVAQICSRYTLIGLADAIYFVAVVCT